MKNAPELKQSNPGLTQPMVMKEVGGLWKNLTPEQKQPFDALAQSDKARYQDQMGQLEKSGYFLNSKGEKCRPSPKKIKRHLAPSPERDQTVFKYKLQSPLSINELRATYPGLEIERASSEHQMVSQITQLQCEKPSPKKKAV